MDGVKHWIIDNPLNQNGWPRKGKENRVYTIQEE